MKTITQDNQFTAIEALLSKDSEAFIEPADNDLQKQIMAGVERDAAYSVNDKPASRKSMNRFMSAISLFAVASILAVTLVPVLIMDDNSDTTVIPQFSFNTEINKVTANIEKVEVASISTMNTEKQALEKDIKSIFKAFKVGSIKAKPTKQQKS